MFVLAASAASNSVLHSNKKTTPTALLMPSSSSSSSQKRPPRVQRRRSLDFNFTPKKWRKRRQANKEPLLPPPSSSCLLPSPQQQQQPSVVRHPKTGELIKPSLKRMETADTYFSCRSEYDDDYYDDDDDESSEFLTCRSDDDLMNCSFRSSSSSGYMSLSTTGADVFSQSPPIIKGGRNINATCSRKVDKNGQPYRVSFSTIEIREFVIQLGNAPYSNGPPICLSNEPCRWVDPSSYYETNTTSSSKSTSSRRLSAKNNTNNCGNDDDDHVFVMDVLKFDEMRLPNRRENIKELRLRPIDRSQMLLSLGYTMDDIALAIIQTEQARRELMQSLQKKRWDSFNALSESAVRKFKKFLLFDQQQSSSPSSSSSIKKSISMPALSSLDL